jgi:O-antigen/teichoic acid export membrane protein
MVVRRSLFRNVTALVSAQVVIKVVNFAVSIAVVRYLGAQELGRYAYVLAFAYPFGILAEFGLGAFAIKEISRNPTRELEIRALLQRAMLLLSGASVLAMMGLAVMVRHDVTTIVGIALAGLSSLLSAVTTPAVVVLTAREDLHLVSLQRVATSALGAIATVAVLLWGGATIALLVAATIVNGVMGVFAHVLVGKGPSLRAARLPAVRAMVRQALPFGIMMLGVALYYRVDMIMLNWLRDPREVGVYAAAYRFLDAVILLAASIGGPFYPRLSSMVGRDTQGVRELLEGTWKPMLALGLPLLLATIILADPLVLALFGNEFGDAGAVLKVLILGSLPLFWIYIPNQALLAADLVFPLARVYGLSVLVNVTVNLFLIPRWGSVGAAVSTVICEWLNLALVVGMIRREFGLSLSCEGLWRYILAAFGMALALHLTRGAGIAIELSSGILTYTGCLLLLGSLRSADMRAMRRLLMQ